MKHFALRLICGGLAGLMLLGAVNTAVFGEGARTSRNATYNIQHPKLAKNFMVVYIRADWCPACKGMKTGWFKVRDKYKDKVRFITLDVTNKAKAAYSAELAEQYGVEDFFEQNKARTSTVAIVALPSHKIIKTFWNEPNPEAYASVIDPMLANAKY